MNSTNQLESCAALNAVCKIVNEDMIPAVITDIVKLLKHDMDAVLTHSLIRSPTHSLSYCLIGKKACGGCTSSFKSVR